ncbi:MAG: T9SS type A sorting domain-containing protein [Flavobacteriales bacterium]|jgi:uncharacterized repeat protein (TIGR01451 family)|nr:T9SS type A sorting domain-containing protein [Flavobacteriales bacterium]
MIRSSIDLATQVNRYFVVPYISASPAPSSVSSNVITWNLTQLTAFQERRISVNFQVPSDVGLLGYELQANASVTTANSDGNLANNSATNLRTITGAYDPNDKLAYTTSGSTDVWQINEDEWIDYTIRFQNTGTDTAFNVVITDTLPVTHDPGSIVMGAASHAFTWDLRGQGTLKFYFSNILLPDSNVNEPRSHGFASFRIKPRLPVLPGSTIENTANIYFDFNPPVITEPSVLTAEFSTSITARDGEGGFQLFPNPVHERLTFVTGSSEAITFTVLATDGRIVLKGMAKGPSVAVDVEGIPPGAYSLRVAGSSGEQYSSTFIKQ